MKKIIVIGCPGSGKTTFSRKLSNTSGIPLFYLDSIWHKHDRTHISREEFDAKLASLLSLDKWIIDGNYHRTLETRLKACDTVFLFDLPTEICIQGAVSRIGKIRPEMPWTDSELDPWLKEEIENFPYKNLPIIYKLLNEYNKNRQIVVFKSREEADRYIEKLRYCDK